MSESDGFSLLELVIVLVLISILAAIAYPSYTNYRIKTHRTDGQTALHILATQMERYFTKHNTYKDATFEQLGMEDKSERGFYKLKLNIENDGMGYQLEASPTGSQAADQQCGNLSLDQKGKKNISGTGKIQDCW
jgi:type IV pilus assembly protein PilE